MNQTQRSSVPTFAEMNLNHALRTMGMGSGKALTRKTKDVQAVVLNALRVSRAEEPKDVPVFSFAHLDREQTLEFIFRGGLELVFRSWPDNATAKQELVGSLSRRVAMAIVLMRAQGHAGYAQFRALFTPNLLAEVDAMGSAEFTWRVFNDLGTYLDRRDVEHDAAAPRRAKLTGGLS